MNSFSWLHFSDLHVWINEQIETSYARDKLIDFLEQEKLKCDYMLITGDIANKGNYEYVNNYMSKLINASDMKTKLDNIFWSIGNHDINREDQNRVKAIQDLRKNPNLFNDIIRKKERDYKYLIKEGMSDYYDNCEDIFKKHITPDQRNQMIHSIYEDENISIIILNTCLTSCDDNDERNLLLSVESIRDLLKAINPKTPTFVIGHHGKDFMRHSEYELVSKLFDDYVVDCYLCGHSHSLGYDLFTHARNDIHQFTCGACGSINDNTKYTFMHGSFDAESKSISVTPYSFNENGEWDKNYNLHRRVEKHNQYRIRRKRVDCNIDDVLNDVEINLDEYFAKAEKDFFISTFFLSYFPTSQLIRKKIDEGLNVRFLIAKYNGISSQCISNMLDGGNINRFNSKLKTTLYELYRSFGSGKQPPNLYIHEIDYPFPNRFYAFDINEPSGNILVQLSHFNNLTARKSHFLCSPSDKWYNVYNNEIDEIWNYSSPADLNTIPNI